VKSVAKHDMESAFETMLARLCPAPEVLAGVPAMAAQVWQEQQGSVEKQKRKLTAKLEEQKKLKSELLRAKLKGEVEQADYEQANVEFTRDMAETERALRALDSAQANADAFRRFSELRLLDVGVAWSMATPEERVRVRNFLFQDGLTYLPDSGISNTSNSCLYTLLEAMTAENAGMAAPQGFEPR
jgi:hypothetical protein